MSQRIRNESEERLRTKPLWVLLVEDNLHHATPFLEAFGQSESAAIQITQTSRLAEALSHLTTASVDAVLMSLKLPDSVGLTGVTCLQAVAPHIPIIVLAQPEEEPLAMAASQNGAQDYLVKRGAIDSQLFASWLRHVVERHRILTMLQATPGKKHISSEPAPAIQEAALTIPRRAATKPARSHQDVSTHTLAPFSSAPPPADMTLATGEVIGGYTIERLLGSGGMGTVYLATQKSLDRKVALKILADHFNQDPVFVKRFEREASALANLSHPNIVVIYDKGIHIPDGSQTSRRCYIVMEYVDGMSLREVIQQRTLTPEKTLKIVPYLCEAFDYAHAQGVVHRDIKPENLLFTRTGQIKISDFGLARLMHGTSAPSTSPITYTGIIMGTKDYMAPEARTPLKRSDHRADVYSLGVVLYEMLTGELPVGKFPPPSQKAPVDPRLDAIVMKALESDPEARYQRALDMGQDILKVVRSDGALSARSMRSHPAQGANRQTTFPTNFPSPDAFRSIRYHR